MIGLFSVPVTQVTAELIGYCKVPPNGPDSN